MRHLIAAGLLFMATSVSAVTPLWMRNVKISPDGKTLAFDYKGDIYTVPATGGTATRLTTQPSYESRPVWSPDGSMIAFAGTNAGSSDIYVMPATGGSATRLTFNSANEYPEAFTPDGKEILFSAAIQDPASSSLFPSARLTEVYAVPVGGGRSVQRFAAPAQMISWLPDGKSYLYQDVKGMEDEWRKHHTSSVTRDVWKYDAATGRHTNLTKRGGEDRNPVASTDGHTVYFLSERDGGTFNVFSFDMANPGVVKQITNFGTHPVRFLSQGNDGTMAFTWNGEIYTLSGEGAKPVKVAIDITLDETPEKISAHTQGARDAALSPDGTQLAFVNRGEVFVTSVDHSSTRQITDTPQAERHVIWGGDDRTLIYVSERDGYYNIYTAKIARKDDPNFSNATIVEETRLFDNDGVERTVPSLSPDGKKLAFIEDRNKLMVRDMTTGKVRQLTDGSTNWSRTIGFDTKWSPDSRWIAIEYAHPLHYAYPDIAIINAETGELTDLTNNAYAEGSPQWVMDGNAIMFASERYGLRAHASWGSQQDVFLVFLNKDAYDRYRLSEEDYALLKEVEKASKSKKSGDDKKTDAKGKSDKKADTKDAEKASEPKPIEIDLTDIEDRIVRLTPNSSMLSDAMLSDDGETLYYITSFEGGDDLWKTSLRKDETKRVTKLGGRGSHFERDGKGGIYIMGRNVRKYDPKSDKLTPVSVNATTEIDPAAEREYMLRYVYNEEKNRFYTPDMHGVQWDSLYAAYSRFLPHINNNFDFATMLSELLGELNVSHTGGRYSAPSAPNPTAALGLLFDMTYDGDGMMVEEVIEKGPLDNAHSSVRPGMILTAINGKDITPDTDISTLLEGIAGRKTLLSFKDKAGATVEEVMLPISGARQSQLLYDRWVKARRADVDRLSGGRLGYVHIQGMNDASFRDIFARLLGEYSDKDGVVIDTRWNGGGRLHEDIEVLFSAEKYLTQDIHGHETSIMPSRRWTKPSIMVTGEAQYSNAHGTPWVYSHKKLGKIVGAPVPGTMTSVNWVTMQDPTMVFGIPVVGFRTAEGNYLENTQLEPDVYVINDIDNSIAGEDQQLARAVEVLLNDIDAAKAK